MRTLQHCNCTARMATPSGGNHQNSNKRLNLHLQSMKASSTATTASPETLRTSTPQTETTPSSTTPAESTRSDDSFLTKKELTTLSPTQQAFLVRKRKYTLGLGPLFSSDSQCSTCEGTGLISCHQCEGTGFNKEHKQDMFDNENVRILNGLVNVSYYFMQGGPCWLCTSKSVIACAQCSGTGLKGGLKGYICD